MKKHINSNGICKNCMRKSIFYSIENGNFVYECLNCKKILKKEDILTDSQVKERRS